VEGGFRDLDAAPPWWRLGFDGKALLEPWLEAFLLGNVPA
jgi:hypothetical protein